MSTMAPMTRRAKTSAAKPKTTSLFWIYAWAVASTLPILPYTAPLWIAVLADTPYAYLVWIPVFAFTWAGWTLRRALSYNDDAELNGIMSVPLLLLAAALLVSGIHNWQYYFVGQSVGLLIWPFWAIGMAWLMFGVSVTGYIIRPLAYLFLTWPPLYSTIVNWTNPILENIANETLAALVRSVHWLHTGATVGAYNVDYGLHQQITVYVTAVCSGADSLLAVLILFPIILVSFIGPVWKKFIAVILASILSLLANLVRLGLIMGSIHVFGPNFSLGILHPALGIILFILMVIFMVRFAHAIGLENRRFQRSPFLRRPGGVRFGASILSFGILTLLLWPLYQGAPGTESSPVPIKTDVLTKLMPSIYGWQRNLVGNYDEASILGPGSKSTAMTFQTLQGDYALAELWWTYQPITLEGYSENNCLLFHGSQIVSSNNLTVAKGIDATAYTVLLPPNVMGGPRDMFIDTVYSFSVNYHGRVAYVRSEIATPVILNLPSNNSIVGQMPGAVQNLLNPNFPVRAAITPLSLNRTIFLHNYLTFIKQYTAALIQPNRSEKATSPGIGSITVVKHPLSS